MKLKVEQTNKTHFKLNTSKNLKPFKIIQLKENKLNSTNDMQETKNDLSTKNLFNSDNKLNQINQKKSSVFPNKSRERALNITSNDKVSKVKESEGNPTKNKSFVDDFSNVLSSKQNLPEIKNKILPPNCNFTTKNKTALHFFKPTNKKSTSISLKKDTIPQEPCLQVHLKKPKKPSTYEDWRSFLSVKNSNQNKNNNFYTNKENNNDIGFNDKNTNNNVDNHSFDMHVDNNHNNSEKKSNTNRCKINKNLNAYLLNRKINESDNVDSFNAINQLNNQNQAFCAKQKKIKKGYNYLNSTKNMNLNKKNNLSSSPPKFNSHFISNNTYYRSNPQNKLSDCYSNEINISKNNTNALPDTTAKNFSTLNTYNLQNLGKVSNPIESLDGQNNLVSKDYSNTKNNINSYNNNNFTSDFQIKENLNPSGGLSSISPADSYFHRRSKCISPLTDNFSNYNSKKNRSMQNFFHDVKIDQNINVRTNSINNNSNPNIKSYNNGMLIQRDLNIESSSNKNKLASASYFKKSLNRPKTVNGISNFNFNARINQETYNSIQEVLVTPRSYLPFSRKRDKLLDLEKQSHMFQDKVEKALKIAKSGAKKITVKSKNELSNYLMRHYFIGEKSNQVEGSK